MNKLVAVKATKQDNMCIKAAVDVIRSVMARFHEANKKTNGTAPHMILQVNDTDALFTIQLSGCPQSPASGRTFDEAFETLCSNPDAAFLRNRAKTLMDKAQDLLAEACKMEGATPQPTAQDCATVASGLKAMTEVGQERDDRTMECTVCHKVKYINDFFNCDVCNSCADHNATVQIGAAAAEASELLEPIFNVFRKPFYGTAYDIQRDMPQIKTSRIRISKAITRNIMFFQDMLGLETKMLCGVTHYSAPGKEITFQEATAITLKNMTIAPVSAAATEGGAK